MKKIANTLLILLLAVSLVGCSNQKTDVKDKKVEKKMKAMRAAIDLFDKPSVRKNKEEAALLKTIKRDYQKYAEKIANGDTDTKKLFADFSSNVVEIERLIDDF